MTTFNNGTVRIANETLAFIAKTAAEEVKGVYNPVEGKVLGLKDNQVKLEILNAGINVDLEVSLLDNVDVRKTVKSIQENVKRQMENMTGLEVGKVNVSVDKLMI